jgi:predicted aspartyl protease
MLPQGCLIRIISLLAALAALALVVPSSNASSHLPLRTASGHLIVVPVYINGHGPFDFLVDTGASTTLIDVHLTAELELKPVGRVSLTTLTGSETVPCYFLDSLIVGAQSLHRLPGLAQEMRAVHDIDPRIRGVLGMDFPLEFAFSVDFGRQQIELYHPSETPELEAGVRIPIQVVGSTILITTTTDASVRGFWSLALDSGIPNMAVFENRIRESQDSRGGWDRKIRITTNLSSISANMGTVHDLALANLHLRDVSVMILPTKPGVDRGIEDGLLPIMFFRRLLVNPKQSYAIFEVASPKPVKCSLSHQCGPADHGGSLGGRLIKANFATQPRSHERPQKSDPRVANESAREAEVIPFEIYDDALIVVKGRIGSLESVNMIIDTGTSPTAISEDVANQLHLRGKTGLLLTSNGAILAQTVALSRIQIGPLQADSIRAVVEDFAFLERKLRIPVGAIVGLDVLSASSFLIDYQKKAITFGRVVAGRKSVRFDRQASLVTVKARIAGQEVRLLVDSGTSGLLLYGDRIKIRPKRPQAFGEALVSTLSGETRSRWFRASSVFLGTQNLKQRTVVVDDSAPDPRNDFDGLLGFKNLGFRKVSFDFTNGVLGWD